VDSLLVAARRSSGVEASNLNRLMDSGELEIERGITITSKVTRFGYKDQIINCVDTPGHADFCGEVDRILSK
jgi:GTP-binding protein